jgi:hypothetical protein
MMFTSNGFDVDVPVSFNISTLMTDGTTKEILVRRSSVSFEDGSWVESVELDLQTLIHSYTTVQTRDTIFCRQGENYIFLTKVDLDFEYKLAGDNLGYTLEKREKANGTDCSFIGTTQWTVGDDNTTKVVLLEFQASNQNLAVIRKIMDEASFKDRLVEVSPFLADFTNSQDPHDIDEQTANCSRLIIRWLHGTNDEKQLVQPQIIKLIGDMDLASLKELVRLSKLSDDLSALTPLLQMVLALKRANQATSKVIKFFRAK